MKKLTLLAVLLPFALIGDTVTVSNKVLWVNQQGEINEPAALATTADMAAIKAATITAEEKASAAASAAAHGTNLISDIVADIGRKELVIYRYGYTDGISAAFVLEPDAKLIINDFKPLNEVNAAGLSAFRIGYALKNSTEFKGQPIIRWKSELKSGATFEPVEESDIEPVSKAPPYIGSDGTVYQWGYSTKFYDRADQKGFYIVDLLADDAAGDGMAMDLPNGVTGGVTADVVWGEYKLKIVGGVVVGVESAK